MREIGTLNKNIPGMSDKERKDELKAAQECIKLYDMNSKWYSSIYIIIVNRHSFIIYIQVTQRGGGVKVVFTLNSLMGSL